MEDIRSAGAPRPTLLILMGVPVLLSFAFRRFYLTAGSVFEAPDEPDIPNSPAGKTAGFRIFDKCMMDGFEGVVKVGGYIIFFSIIIALFRKAAGGLPVFLAAAPLLEVTNGILLIHEKVADPITAYAFTVGLTAFGGLCSVAQTDCMLQGSGLPYSLYHTKTDCRSGSQSDCLSLYADKMIRNIKIYGIYRLYGSV